MAKESKYFDESQVANLEYILQTKKLDHPHQYSVEGVVQMLINMVPGVSVNFSVNKDNSEVYQDFEFYEDIQDYSTSTKDILNQKQWENAFTLQYNGYATGNVNAACDDAKKEIAKIFSELKQVYKRVTGKALSATELKDSEFIRISPWRNSYGDQQYLVAVSYSYTR